MPQISIIIPAHNVEKYIITCLESIYNQTFQDYECIIVENGSKDNTAKVVEDYIKDKPKFKLIVLDSAGVCKARNAGIDKATSKYIAFMDSDDYISEDYFKGLYDAILLEDDIDMSVVGYEIVYSHKKKVIKPLDNGIYNIEKDINHKKIISKFYHSEANMALWAKLFKKDIIDKYNIRLREDIGYHEDFCFLGEYILRCKKIAASTVGLYYYIVERVGNTTTTMTAIKWVSNRLKVHNVFFDVLKDDKIYLDLANKDFAAIFIGYKFGESNIRSFSKKEIKELVTFYKEKILSINLNPEVVTKLMAKEWEFFKFLVKINTFSFYPRFARVIRNILKEVFKIKFK